MQQNMIPVQQVIQRLVIPMVVQLIMNMKQGTIKLKLEQQQLNLKNYPTDSEASSSLGPFDITSSTDKIDTRARARAIALKVSNTGLAQHWKVGTFRLDIQPDGRR